MSTVKQALAYLSDTQTIQDLEARMLDVQAELGEASTQRKADTSNLAVPTIHTNGTSQDALLDAVTDAGSAISDAMRALEATAPHGRDYYPQGPEALKEATKQYSDRVARLKSVLAELRELAEAIADGGHSAYYQ